MVKQPAEIPSFLLINSICLTKVQLIFENLNAYLKSSPNVLLNSLIVGGRKSVIEEISDSVPLFALAVHAGSFYDS